VVKKKKRRKRRINLKNFLKIQEIFLKRIAMKKMEYLV
jgi:hypothetical protein